MPLGNIYAGRKRFCPFLFLSGLYGTSRISHNFVSYLRSQKTSHINLKYSVNYIQELRIDVHSREQLH
jgi:hypothetical protein